jgi:hypothetical protein
MELVESDGQGRCACDAWGRRAVGGVRCKLGLLGELLGLARSGGQGAGVARAR